MLCAGKAEHEPFTLDRAGSRYLEGLRVAGVLIGFCQVFRGYLAAGRRLVATALEVFFRVIIGIMENDFIFIIQILLTYIVAGMDTVQSIHPARKITVCELSKCHTIVSNGRDVVARLINHRDVIFLESLSYDIQNRCIITDRIRCLFNPCC